MRKIEPPQDVEALAVERDNYVRQGRPERAIPVDEQLALRGWCVNTGGNLVQLEKDRRAATADPAEADAAAKEAAAAAKKAEADAVEAQRAADRAAKLAAAGRNESEEARVAKLQAKGRADGQDDDEEQPAKGRSRRPRERAVSPPAENTAGD